MDEYRTHLIEILDRIQSYGFYLQMKRCMFLLPRISYRGSVKNKNDLRLDTNKIAPRFPSTKTTLQSFLGMANYYDNFMPNMPQLLVTLNNLWEKDTNWFWSLQCQKITEKVLLSEIALIHYNPHLPIIVGRCGFIAQKSRL